MSATCTPADCNAWHNAGVSIHWTIDPDPPATVSPGCADATFSSETADLPVQCDATWTAGVPLIATGTVHIKIDKSAPTGVGGLADRPPDTNGWYNHKVGFAFSAGGDALSGIAGCTSSRYSGPDGVGLTVAGSCSDVAGNVGAGGSSPFSYDATPPTITGVSPSRPPDHDGWYTHRVVVTFEGKDATSGILSCDATSYGGPDGRNVKISGGCRDVAGNGDQATLPIKYDATPPASPAVHVAPGNRRADVSWTLPGEAATVTVTRSRQGGTSPPKVIYTGTGTSVLDQGLRNHRKYRYTVTDADEAGNTNSKAIAAVPTASSLRPFPGTAVSTPPSLHWKRVGAATYYNVQLYRGGTKVLSTWPREPFFDLPRRWRFRRHTYTLARGHYRWYVWPGYGSLSANRYGKMLGRSSFRFVG